MPTLQEIRHQGWIKTILTKGNEVDFPKPGEVIAMHYTGCLYNPDETDPEKHNMGKKFDSSYDRNQPLSSPIGVQRLIRGWDEGVPKMSLGERAILSIAPEYAYGNQAIGGDLIPANSTLVFDVKLVSIGSGLSKKEIKE